MWVATNFGFFSVVQRPQVTRSHDSELLAALDLQVRARELGHITELRRRMGLMGRDIQRWTNSDYEFRMFISYDEWAHFMARLTYDITYDNFKSSVVDRRLHDAYLRVWGVIASTFDRRTYRGKRGKNRHSR